MHGLLNVWGLELQHLNPTGVLHIAGFVTIYEAFYGMEPHVDLFRWIFSGRALFEGKLPRTAPVGGFTLQKKSKPSAPTLRTPPMTPIGGWHDLWFYIRNPVEAPFLSFTKRRPERRGSWLWGPIGR